MPRLLVLVCSLLAAVPALAAPPAIPAEPLLRIETGAHLAPITRISVDAAGQWAVTAGEDKTARLWELKSGRALAVLRPPVGSEGVGALYAAAMSPDGRQVALGGNAAFDGKTHALYLFDRASASLPAKSTLSGLEAPLTQIAWSADSQLLAVGLRQQGLRVFRRNLGLVGADPEYNDAIYGAAFAPDGRLAVAGLDGYLRLYGVGKNGLERLARKQLPGKPYALAWSPDGQTLAVGLQDVPRVLLLAATTLDAVHVAEVAGSGNLGRVAWSADGQRLYAAGSAARGGRFGLFEFAGGGRGAPREIGNFGNIVTSLASHADGLLVAAADPAWAAYDGGGNRRFLLEARNGDFRDAGDAFRVDRTGQVLALPLRMGGRDGVVVDLAQGELRPSPPPAEFPPARPPAGLAEWKNGAAPTLAGKPLALRPGEIARSAVALPDGRRFALGSDWFLRLFAEDGAALWSQRTPAAVWALAASGDGRWLVAALGDGSVRWYRAGDGSEQLALYVDGDRERWIAWTPGGYYDTSMGGENLVGWHVNRAFNQAADFYSVGRFRDRFYRPAVIQQVLQLADEAEAVRASRPAKAAQARSAVVEALPPVIELQSERSLLTAEALVPVRYLVRTPADAPVKEVRIRVNGRLERNLKTRATRSPEGQVIEALVPVPPKDTEITLVAENRHAKSDPQTLVVRRPGGAARTPFVEKYETLYMLVVAVNKYSGKNALQLPVKDAADFNRQMARVANPPAGKPRLYERAETRLLLDEQATQENVRAGLKWLRDKVGERDAGVIFLAGHGMSQEQSYYFIPYRGDGIGGQEDWVAGKEIVDTLQNLPGRAMFFLDTCHSGALANQAKVAGTVNQVDDERGVIVFASATARELAMETDEWGNGAFTKALVEGLRGEAEDPRDKLVYPTTLKRYVTRRVRELTDNQQRPYVSDHGIDDPIAVVVK